MVMQESEPSFPWVEGTSLGDHLDRVLDHLSTDLAAAVERAEEVAARDLALSLLQDLTQGEALARSGGLEVVVAGKPSLRVTRLGTDHLEADDCSRRVLFPSATTVVARVAGPAPVVDDLSLATVMQRAARAGAQVSAVVGSERLEGRLLRAGRDHLVVASSRGETFVPVGSLASVELSYED